MARISDSKFESIFPAFNAVDDAMFKKAVLIAAQILYPSDDIFVNLYTMNGKRVMAQTLVRTDFSQPDEEMSYLCNSPLFGLQSAATDVFDIKRTVDFFDYTGKFRPVDNAPQHISLLNSSVFAASQFANFTNPSSPSYLAYKKKISDAIFKIGILRKINSNISNDYKTCVILATVSYILNKFYENNFSQTSQPFRKSLAEIYNGYNLIKLDAKNEFKYLINFVASLSDDMDLAILSIGNHLSSVRSDFSIIYSLINYKYDAEDGSSTYIINTAIGQTGLIIADFDHARLNHQSDVNRGLINYENLIIDDCLSGENLTKENIDTVYSDIVNNYKYGIFDAYKDKTFPICVVMRPRSMEETLSAFALESGLSDFHFELNK